VPQVFLPADLAQKYCSGENGIPLIANDMRDVIEGLEKQFPGIRTYLESGYAVAIDSSIVHDWLFEDISQESQIRFIPAIEGG